MLQAFLVYQSLLLKIQYKSTINGLNKLNKLLNPKVNNQRNSLTFLYFIDIFFFDISFHLGHKTNLDLTIGRLRKEDATNKLSHFVGDGQVKWRQLVRPIVQCIVASEALLLPIQFKNLIHLIDPALYRAAQHDHNKKK